MEGSAESGLFEKDGVRVAVEGCGHGTLNAIYAAVAAAAHARGWPGVDLLIICGDFQSTRNGHDVEVLSVPAKYRVLGDFHEYYSGTRTAPYLTLFIAGNHEAAAYLWELYYGGWVAPNIYYMGAANVLRVGPLRIAGLSGIWKGFDYRKPHLERLPFSRDDIKSFYHVREFDVRRLLQIKGQVDVGLSHDWPRGVEKHGDVQQLYRTRPMWKEESLDGSLGSPAAEYVMDRLRPAFWFSAHMHWKFASVKTYPSPSQAVGLDGIAETVPVVEAPPAPPMEEAQVENPNEIDLDMDDEDSALPEQSGNDDPAAIDDQAEATATVTDDLRAQLPASFTQQPKPKPFAGTKRTPGQPVPLTITNTTVRFLALNKCEPGRDFLQLCGIQPIKMPTLDETPQPDSTPLSYQGRFALQYDPEWLAIARHFHQHLTIGDRTAQVAADEGEEAYAPKIAEERAWVEDNIVRGGKLAVPHNFAQTAPALVEGADEKLWELHSGTQPREHTNPQTVAFCALLGVENLWDASEEERERRRQEGPPPEADRGNWGSRDTWRGTQLYLIVLAAKTPLGIAPNLKCSILFV
ncbi:putative lariat debranching enzyme [Diaporthe ampelina]|uniref:Putative lariat debranching enzyme n=1 Tax=Diaporthe ampelina TaxID=1214573 RepID=A0A0G2F5D3_9PEZI|nr:putative lariat debranching enzyme [Diaporthe ampelina]